MNVLKKFEKITQATRTSNLPFYYLMKYRVTTKFEIFLNKIYKLQKYMRE